MHIPTVNISGLNSEKKKQFQIMTNNLCMVFYKLCICNSKYKSG